MLVYGVRSTPPQGKLNYPLLVFRQLALEIELLHIKYLSNQFYNINDTAVIIY